MANSEDIVQLIGKKHFTWMTSVFGRETTLQDLPGALLDRLAAVDITLRNYAADPKAITCIALITFAYKMAGKVQRPQCGAKDILLLRVLAKNERERREGKRDLENPFWKAPVFALLTGEVGERIRSTRCMSSPG